MEAAEAGIKVIVCITEGIPVADMVKVKEYIKDKGARLIGQTAQESSLQTKLKLVLCQVSFSKKVK
jgi:succinyl-CoA synthetase alpha subunit